MIRHIIPWDSNKNIGQCYNRECEALPSDDDYACFVDGDARFTTPMWGKQLEDIVAKYPECGLFTAMTNRIGCLWQRTGDWKSDSDAYHNELGEILCRNFYDQIQDVSVVPRGEVMGGVLILIRKSTWKKLGGFKSTGMLGVDNDIHWKAMDNNEKVYLMKGVYLYHWYRGGDANNKGHLI